MKSWLAFAIGGLLAAVIVAAIFQAKYSGGDNKTVASVTLPDQAAPPANPSTPPPAESEPPPAAAPATPPRPRPPAAHPVNPPPTTPPPTATIPPPPQQENPPALPPATPSHPPAPVVPPPPPPRVAKTVTIAAGTLVPVRVMERISTETHKIGDTFPVTLDEPLVVDGFVIAEKGARGQAKVTQSDRAGKVKGLSQLAFELDWLTTADGQRLTLETSNYLKEGEKSTKQDAAKIGIGAAVGAAIGAIAGGGKGAAIGGAAGAGAGTGAVLATRGADAVVNVEERAELRITQARKVTEKLK